MDKQHTGSANVRPFPFTDFGRSTVTKISKSREDLAQLVVAFFVVQFHRKYDTTPMIEVTIVVEVMTANEAVFNAGYKVFGNFSGG